jgi:hypothetical protein
VKNKVCVSIKLKIVSLINLKEKKMLTLKKTALFQILFFSTFVNISVIPEQISEENSRYNNQDVQFDEFNRIVYNSEKVKINYSFDEFRIANGNAKSKENDFFFSNKSDNINWRNEESLQLSKQNLLDSLTLEQNWKTGIFGSGIGLSGIITDDINNDNSLEIICDGFTGTFGGGSFWYILKYSETTQEYDMIWISNLYPQGISNITVFDIDGDGIYNIYIGFSDGHLGVYNGATLEEIDYIDTPLNSINRILYDDADNDLIKEIVLCDDSKILICDSNTLTFEHQINYGANDFEIGNVDSDTENEIVLSNGKVLEFENGITNIEWQYSGGDFGYLIELSDIDSDNMEEIIGASNWALITAFDADIQSPKWQIPTSQDIGALLVRDVDGDNIDDILYGDGQWGEIHCYDAITQIQKWQIANPEHGVTNIAVVDADKDSNLEILWGAGATSSGPDYLYIHQISTLALEWRSDDLDGPFYAIDVGDPDNDGDIEIVVISFESNSSYGDGIVQIFNAVTHALEWKSDDNMFGGYAWTGIHDVKIGDVDDDSEQEIVVATDRLYDGAIYIINGVSHTIEQSYFYDNGAPIYSLAIADVDNDNQTEIIAGGGREHTGAPGVYVYVINGTTGIVEWHSISLGDYWSAVTAVEVQDIDNDMIPEIVALNNNVFIFDGISYQQWQITLSGCNGLDLYDIDYDDIEDIVVGTSSGKLIAIDGQNYSEKFNFTASSNEIVGLQIYDIQNDGDNEIIFGSTGRLNIFSITDANVIWQSETLGTIAGRFNSIVVSDIDSDQRAEIIIGTDYTVVGLQEPEVVPVELTSFTAVSQNGNVLLDWSSSSELNTLGFEVQRQTNLYEFLTIGFVNAHGTTTESNRYSFVDSDLRYGNYSYRLKQVDFNGSFTYSEEVNVIVTTPLQFYLAQNYPNPFNPMTRILYSISKESFVTLRIYNIIGEEVETMVNEIQQPGNYSVIFNASNVSSGVYFYTLNADNFSEVKKMIISK